MSYTVEELDTVIEDEDSAWEGSWHEFLDKLESTHEYVTVPEGTEGARSYDGGKTFELRQRKAQPGVALPVGLAELVEDHGGGEGSGEERWFVFSVTNDEGVRHFRRNGYYASFYGSDFDGPTEEVEAVPTVVTVWKAK